MSDEIITYKIRRGQLFSNGVIVTAYGSDDKVMVNWNRKGKEWKTKKALKDHLTKWVSLMGNIPADWEIFELTYKATPVMDWVDSDMLTMILTYKKIDNS